MYFGTPSRTYTHIINVKSKGKKKYNEGIKYLFEKRENVLNTFKFTYFDVPKQISKKK